MKRLICIQGDNDFNEGCLVMYLAKYEDKILVDHNNELWDVPDENWMGTEFLESNELFLDYLSVQTLKKIRQELINDRTETNYAEINNYLVDIDIVLVGRAYNLPI